MPRAGGLVLVLRAERALNLADIGLAVLLFGAAATALAARIGESEAATPFRGRGRVGRQWPGRGIRRSDAGKHHGADEAPLSMPAQPPQPLPPLP